MSTFFHYNSATTQRLHPSPTRRSSDLAGRHPQHRHDDLPDSDARGRVQGPAEVGARGLRYIRAHAVRSEEHTSELQSPCNLVCRLLLEKKKTEFATAIKIKDHKN